MLPPGFQMRTLTTTEKQRLFEGHALFGILAPSDIDALLSHARWLGILR